MKKSQLFIATVALLSAFVLGSCEKDDDSDATQAQASVTMAADDEIVTSAFDEATTDSDDAENVTFTKKGGSQTFQGCASISRTIEGNSKILVIDFGSEGCTSPRGHVKKGKIILTLTGVHFTTGFTKTIEFQNFYMDGNLIEGKRTISTTLTGLTLSQRVVIENGRVTLTDGVVISFEEDKTRTLTQGLLTPTDFSDDVWEITGSSSGVNYNQVAYSMMITKPIVRNASCKFAVSGTKVFTAKGHTATLDYGNGTCDKIATVTSGNLTKEIEIGKRWKASE
jgi:hypothetical protein